MGPGWMDGWMKDSTEAEAKAKVEADTNANANANANTNVHATTMIAYGYTHMTINRSFETLKSHPTKSFDSLTCILGVVLELER